MQSLDELRRALAMRLAQERASFTRDELPNPLAGAGIGPEHVNYNPLRNVPVVGGATNMVANLPLHLAGLIGEAGTNVARPISGAVLAQSGRALDLPVVGGMLQNPQARLAAQTIPGIGNFVQAFGLPGMIAAARAAREAQDRDTGDPIQRALAAETAATETSPLLTMLTNTVYNPLTWLAPGAKVAEARNLPRLASLLRGGDVAQNLPFSGGQAARGLRGLMGPRTAEPVAQMAANLAPEALRGPRSLPAPVQRAGLGAVGGAGAGAAAFGQGEVQKRQREDGTWVDLFGQPTTPPDKAAMLKGALIGAAGGAVFGSARGEGGLASSLAPAHFNTQAALERLVGKAEAPELRALLPGKSDPELARIIIEGASNRPAEDFANFVNTNWERAQAGQLSAHDVINAYVPAVLSQRRKGMSPESVLGNLNRTRQLRDVISPVTGQPELEGLVKQGLIQGGGQGGQYRPEDLAAIMLHHTQEGQDLGAALRYGDPEAVQTAMENFNALWPNAGFMPGQGDILPGQFKVDRRGRPVLNKKGEPISLRGPGNVDQGEMGALKAAAQDDVFSSIATMMNRLAAGGASPEEVAATMRDVYQGGSGAMIDRIANGKSGFLTTIMGAPDATFDVRVEQALRPGATVDDYKRALAIMFPGDDFGLAHHKFWDAQDVAAATGTGSQTGHGGIAESVARQQAGAIFPNPLNAGLDPQSVEEGVANFAKRFARPVEKEAIDTTRVSGPDFGTPKAWTPAQNAIIDEVMRIKEARVPQDKLDLQKLSLASYATRMKTADGFNDLWQTLVDNIRQSQVLEVGYGSDIGEMARTVEGGLGRRAGFDPDLGTYEDLIDRKMGRVRDTMTRPQVENFVGVEDAAHANLGAGHPLARDEAGNVAGLNPEATPPMYASYTEGQPSGMEMGGTFRQFVDLAQKPRYLVTVHHHYLTAAKEVEDFHAKKTAAAVKQLWGPENQLIRDLLGRGGVVPVGETGNTLLDTPLIVHPDAAPEARAAMLVLSATADELKTAATDPQAAAFAMLRGSAMRGNRTGKERLVHGLGGVRNVRRTEALLFDQDPKFTQAMAYGGGSTAEDPRALALMQKYLDQFGIGDRPIYRLRAPKGALPDVLPPDISPGRQRIIEGYTARGLEDVGAGLSPQALKASLTNPVARGALGGVAGGLVGSQQGDTPEERLQNTLKGGAIGALGAGVGPEVGKALYTVASDFPGAIEDTVLDPKALRLFRRQADAAQAASKTAPGAKLGELPRAIDDFWRRQVVNTLRGLGLDAASLWTLVKDWGRDYGVDRLMIKGRFGELVDHFDDADPLDRLGGLGQTLRAWGLDRMVDKETGVESAIGTGFLDQAGRPRPGEAQLSAPQRALVGAGLSFANLREAVIPIAGPVWGAFRGHMAPWVNAFYGTANGLQHAAARTTFWEAALDRELPVAAARFADELRPMGIDLSPLLGSGRTVNRTQLEGFLRGRYKGLTPDEVTQIADEFDNALETTAKAEGDKVAKIFGDFREGSQSAWKTFLGRIFPFSNYALTMAPTYGRMLKRNPLVTGGLVGTAALSAAATRNNDEPPWNAGTVPISTETPGLGALARIRLGGQQGTVRVSPLNLLGGPIGADTLAGMRDLPDDATVYDKAKAALDMAGLSPHPVGEFAARELGLTRDTPGALSRTAGIEQAAELLPGMPMLPTAQGPSNAVVGAVTGQTPDDYDAVARRYALLVQDETGLTLDDPKNRKYLVAVGDETNPLWQQAQREVRLAGLVGGLVSNTLPLSNTATSTQTEAYGQARAAQANALPNPYLGREANYGAKDPTLGLRLAASYAARHPKSTPVSSPYRGASTAGRERILADPRGSFVTNPTVQRLLAQRLAEEYRRKDR